MGDHYQTKEKQYNKFKQLELTHNKLEVLYKPKTRTRTEKIMMNNYVKLSVPKKITKVLPTIGKCYRHFKHSPLNPCDNITLRVSLEEQLYEMS